MDDRALAEPDLATHQHEQPQSARALPRHGWAVIDVAWFLFFAIASSVYCLSAVRHLSATFDEPGYVVDGLERWRSGSYDTLMKWGTMPLPVDLATLPLYLKERWTGGKFDPVADFDRMIAITRSTNLIFWWLILGAAWLCASQIGGRWAARIAVGLLACEPNLLAHAALTTTDIAITAMLLFLALVYRRGRDDPRWSRRVLFPGLVYGVALLAKASALVFGPLCMLAIEIDHRVEQGKAIRGSPHQGLLRSWKPWFDEVLRIVGIGALVIFIYIRSDWLPEPTFVKWAQTLHEGVLRTVMLWISQHLCIFTNAGEGIVQQIKHNIRGHGAYLLGRTWQRDVWYYFPVALSIKLSEATLLLPLLITIVRPRLMRNWASISAAFLLLFSLNSHVQIGVRMMFPLVALAIVGTSAAIAKLIAGSRVPLQRVLIASAITASIGWTAIASLRIWPDGLTYINTFWGGPTNGYMLISDSNYDWGQGMKELKQWVLDHGGGPIDIWYFGTDPMRTQPPFNSLALNSPHLKQTPEIVAALSGRRVAVSMTLVYGAYGTKDTDSIQQVGAYLRQQRPIDRTRTFLIYEFPAQTEQH